MDTFLLVCSLICFVADAIISVPTKVKLSSLGLAFFVTTLLV